MLTNRNSNIKISSHVLPIRSLIMMLFSCNLFFFNNLLNIRYLWCHMTFNIEFWQGDGHMTWKKQSPMLAIFCHFDFLDLALMQISNVLSMLQMSNRSPILWAILHQKSVNIVKLWHETIGCYTNSAHLINLVKPLRYQSVRINKSWLHMCILIIMLNAYIIISSTFRST